MNELHVTCSLIRPSIIVICESWLNECISDDQVSLTNYSSFRKDRNDGRRGGGVIVFVHESFYAERLHPEYAAILPIEDIWFSVPSLQILFLALYIPPNLSSATMQQLNDQLIDITENIFRHSPAMKLIIIGDLNNFQTDELENTFSLTPIVSSPTRGSATLDKILVENSLANSYYNATVGPSLGNSDHHSVFMTAGDITPPLYHINKVYDLRKSHIDRFRNFLRSYPWQHFFRSDADVEDKCNLFYDIIQEALALIPHTNVPFTQKDKAWITPLIKSIINKRYEAFRKKDYEKYNHYKNKVKVLIEEAKKKWIQSTKRSPNGLWKICNDALNLSKTSTLSSLIHSFPSSSEAAEKINEEFCKNFSSSPNWATILSSLNSLNSEDWSPEISVPAIIKELKNLKMNKAPGNDGLSPRLLSKASPEFAPPICHMICLSIQHTTVPSRWKMANVTPIPKKRNPSIQDLRPISILPTISKIMEKCVLNSIKEKLVNLYGPEQFGFRPHCSTEFAHIRAHEFMTANLDNPSCVAILIMSFDMHKAFDCLRHDSLLLSLADGKLPKKFLLWIASFLQNRTQRVRLPDSTLSTLRNVTSGVPQGSLLAPFLFSSHVRSLLNTTPSALTIKYADDVMTLIPIHTGSNIDDIIMRENNYVQNWCHDHGMKINVSKTKQMLCKKHSPVNLHVTSNLCKTLKILGVIYDENLSWNAQIQCMTKKANQKCFLLRNLKSLLTKDELVQIYHAFILSNLEFCSGLLVGVTKQESEQLEKVRRRCHRIICGPNCNCDSFTPLFIRRYHHALKIFKSMFKSDHILHDLKPPTLRHSSKLVVPHIRTSRRHSSFIPYCTSLFNRICT